MKIKISFILLLSVVLVINFSNCSKSNNNGDDDKIPIALSSKVTVEIRNSTVQDIQIAGNQQVSFFVTKTSSISELVYDNAILSADGDGGFSYSYEGQSILYYPTEPGNVDFYAIHPYNENITLGNTTNFKVNRNQTVLKDFFDSDLLFSRVLDVAKTRNTVAMTFNHKLCKINFIIKKGVGIDLNTLSSINIQNVIAEIDMNTSDGTLVPISAVAGNIEVYGVQGTSGNEISGMAAIIVPQTFTAEANKRLFKLTINNVDYFYTPTTNITFESGKKYNYTLTVNNSGIEVSSEIVDWIPGGDTEGEVTVD